MSDSTKQSSNLMAFGFLFTLIAVVALIALILSNSAADTEQNATIDPSAPVLSEMTVSIISEYGATAGGTITPTAGTTKSVYVHGVVTDDNGCETLDTNAQWDATLYRTNVASGSACTADEQNCYAFTGANVARGAGTDTCADSNDTDMDYAFTVPLQYFADATVASADSFSATTWTAWVSITDDETLNDTDSLTFEVGKLLALNVDETSVEYGALALGENSFSNAGSATPVTIANYGNYEALDPVISQAAAWDCTIPNGIGSDIAIANTDWSLTAAEGGSWTNMTNSPASLDLDIAQAASSLDAAATEDVYMMFTVPSVGVGGDCTSQLTVGVAD